MKKTILSMIVLLTIASPIAAFADCTVYSYAELTDMSPAELQSAYKEVSDAEISAIKWQTKFIGTGDRASQRKEAERAKVCYEQGAQIKRVWVKKSPGVELAQ